jgi:hypothetical protein
MYADAIELLSHPSLPTMNRQISNLTYLSIKQLLPVKLWQQPACRRILLASCLTSPSVQFAWCGLIVVKCMCTCGLSDAHKHRNKVACLAHPVSVLQYRYRTWYI